MPTRKKEASDEEKTIKEIPKLKSYFYLGPTLKRGVLQKGNVFRGKLPQEVKNLIKTNPLIEALIVDKSIYLKSLKELGTKGSRLEIIYSKLKNGGN